MKHHSRPHYTPHTVAIAGQKVIEERLRQLEKETEAIRQDYQRQLEEKGEDDWYRCLAFSGLVYREITGSTSKTEKFLSRLAEVMERDRGKPTAEIVAELERVTGIELEVQ